MVQYRRNRVAGGTFFFTVNLRDRSRTLLAEHADALRDVVRDVRTESPFVIDAMVVMSDHWHAVWTLPPDDADYARRIQRIKARFTKHLLREGVSIPKDGRGEYRLWQKRFWEHTIHDDRDFETHVNYVHINPVKHGYVARAADWRIRRCIDISDAACWRRIGLGRRGIRRIMKRSPEYALLLPGYTY
jgi:putative transposase